MSDSVRPHRRQPTRLPRPWGSPGKNTGVGCHFLLQCMKVKSESEVAQSCPTLSDPMDCSLPGSSVHGISQARVLEWGAIAFSQQRLTPLINQDRELLWAQLTCVNSAIQGAACKEADKRQLMFSVLSCPRPVCFHAPYFREQQALSQNPRAHASSSSIKESWLAKPSVGTEIANED